MMEYNPVEAIKNNVFGTKNLIETAKANNVSKFVLISTDKAVEPSCVYGTSKMLAEELVLNASRENNSDFMVVRFGNVLASKGSIIPLFVDQIKTGGPVTITHPDAERFFMTIPEAVSLVLKTGGLGKNGELYILEMGEAVNIKRLAENLITFFGFEAGEDIKLKYIGLRPGEKLKEKLWAKDEETEITESEGICRLIRKPRFKGKLKLIISELEQICFLNQLSPEKYRSKVYLSEILDNIKTMDHSANVKIS